MKIRYKRKRLRSNLIIGLGYTITGIVMILIPLFFPDSSNYAPYFMGVGFIVLGFCLLMIYYFEKRNQYLTIENGNLTKHSILSKRIKLDDIEQVKEFAGDYKLRAADTELVINTQIIEKDSLEELNNELNRITSEIKLK